MVMGGEEVEFVIKGWGEELFLVCGDVELEV